MAVRVTAGRISIAATLAVVLGAVVFNMENRGFSGRYLQGNTTIDYCYTCIDEEPWCVPYGTITIPWYHTWDSRPAPDCAEIASRQGLSNIIDEYVDIDENGYIDGGETCAVACYHMVTHYPSSASTSRSSASSVSSGSSTSQPSSVSTSRPSSVSTSHPSSTSTSHPSSTSSYTSSASSYSSVYIPNPQSPSSTSTSFSYSSSTSTSSSTSDSSNSSSVSSGRCGDGIVQKTDPGIDGVAGNADDWEECDDGNDIDSDSCTTRCTVPRCGDGLPDPDGLNNVNEPDGAAGSDDEECDDGANNTWNNGDETKTFCKPDCTRPMCSDGYDNFNAGDVAALVAAGGVPPAKIEFGFPDGLSDKADGACQLHTCFFDPVLSPYVPGRDTEENPCMNDGDGEGTVSTGGLCESNGDCQAYSPGGSVFCLQNAGSQSRCTDAGVNANQIAAQGLPAGFQFPVCQPLPGCNMGVGDDAGCRPGPMGGLDKASCADQVIRMQCLQATAQQQCAQGIVKPIMAGQQWSCWQGDPNNPQWMCGNAGRFWCECPPPNNVPPPAGPWVPNLQQCPDKCGNKQVDPGEECDDGNQDNGDACSNTCKKNNVGTCDGVDACANPVAQQMCGDQGKICQNDNQGGLPCMKCVEEFNGNCQQDGANECALGGDDFCSDGEGGPGNECSLTQEEPCIACIPPNQCGNGEINHEEPVEVDEGCELGGTANQFCMNEGQEPANDGIWQQHQQCFQTAHCQNVDGVCAWENTPELEECIEENGGGLPPGCQCDGEMLVPGSCDPDVVFFRNPCEQLPGVHASAQLRLAAQVGGGEGVVCSADTRRCCGNDGEWYWVNHDPANNCAFPACEDPDGSSCAAAQPDCQRAGCNGTQCVPAGTAAPATWCAVDPTAACYNAHGNCRSDGAGGCAWAPSPALDECLNDNAGDTPCDTDETCMSGTACADEGGTAGIACGADNTNTCCSGAAGQPEDPVEQCDDGNQNDEDACGNDCRINCQNHADCNGGAACVNGECVDQCVEDEDDDDGDDGDEEVHCHVTGTYDELCFPEGTDMESQRPWRPTDDCYKSATCGPVDRNGEQVCGWVQTPELVECLNGGDGPDLQGGMPGDFFTRLMAQGSGNNFRLLP